MLLRSAARLLELELVAFVAVAAHATLHTPAPPPKPHIFMMVADDYGWANAGWHRSANDRTEVRTPHMNALVAAGVELDRAYQYKFCSPSRCSLQSGRLPVHVNHINADPAVHNAADPVSGFAGIPRAMTGIAEHLKRASPPYATHFIGKWDAGMVCIRVTVCVVRVSTVACSSVHATGDCRPPAGRAGLR
jgi:arylsulfatase B